MYKYSSPLKQKSIWEKYSYEQDPEYITYALLQGSTWEY